MSMVLAVSLAGLSREAGLPWAGGAREAIEWASASGFRGVQLDASVVRGRELDRSARRGLAALLRQRELEFAGLDLWIPAGHFLDEVRQERAVDATLDAIGLVGELCRLNGARQGIVSVELPSEAREAREAIAASAERAGVVVADHSWPFVATHDPVIAMGLDPARVLLGGGDPVVEARRLAGGSARLSDVGAAGRVAAGASGGRLDVLAYVASLATTGYARCVILDLRGVAAQEAAARTGWESFEEAIV